MSQITKLLKGILKTSGWTQEQLADKLGVSFVSLNAWVNGRTRPRKAMQERIEQLYLAQDVTKDVDPTYVTLVNVERGLRVGDPVLLTKDVENVHDDEAIIATVLDLDVPEMEETEWEELPKTAKDDKGVDEIKVYTEQAVSMDCPGLDGMYVANSVNTVVRGTSSAGRIYDKFRKSARAQVAFVFHRMAIARVVEWEYEA